jgi:hypothetical protein
MRPRLWLAFAAFTASLSSMGLLLVQAVSPYVPLIVAVLAAGGLYLLFSSSLL